MNIPILGSFTFPAPYNTRGIRLTNRSNAPNGCAPRHYSYYSVVNNHQNQDHLFVVIGRNSAPPLFIKVHKESGQIIEQWSPEWARGEAEGWYFSDKKPRGLYLVMDSRLMCYDVVSKEMETIFSLDPRYGASIWQAHSSADDKVHSATVRDTAYQDAGFVVYRQDQQYPFGLRNGYDECQIDKSGRYLVVKAGLEPPGGDNIIIDLDTGDEYTILDRDGAVGHSDCGNCILIGEDDSSDRWQMVLWDLRAPSSSHQKLLRGGSTWGNGMGHNAVRGNRVLVSNENGLIIVSTDGSQKETPVAPSLMCPPTSPLNPYDWQVRASWDPIAEYACWLANCDGSHRLDAFLVQTTISSPQILVVNPPKPGGSMQSLAISTDGSFKEVKLKHDSGYEAVGVPGMFDDRPAYLIPLSDSLIDGHGAELTLVWDDGITLVQHGFLNIKSNPPRFSPNIFTKPTGF